MPIVVSHQPDLGFLAQAGYVAGLGEYQQRQQEMAQRERMQIRGIQANFQSQAFETQAGFARQNMDFQQQMLMGDAEAKRQKEMFDVERQDKFDMFKMEMEAQRRNEMLRNESFMNRDIAQFYLGQVSDTRKRIDEMLMDGYEFTPEGQKQWESLQAELAKIQEDATITPVAKAEAMYKLTMAKSPIPEFKRPDMQQRVDENTVWKKDEETGKKVLVGNAREFAVLFEPEAEKPDKEENPKSLREHVFSGTKEGNASLMSIYKMFQTAMTKTDPVTGAETPPSDDEIWKKVDSYITNHDSRMQAAGQQQPGQPTGQKVTKKTWTPEGGVK